jgi:hypothetical protein
MSGHVECMGEKRNVHVLWLESLKEQPLGKGCCRWEDIFKVIFVCCHSLMWDIVVYVACKPLLRGGGTRHFFTDVSGYQISVHRTEQCL